MSALPVDSAADAVIDVRDLRVRVNDTDPDLLRYLADIEIGIGMTVRVEERLPFAGSLRITVRSGPGGRGRDRSLGLVAAEALWIAPAES